MFEAVWAFALAFVVAAGGGAADADPVDTGRAFAGGGCCACDSDSPGVFTLGCGMLTRAPSGLVVVEAVADGDLDNDGPPGMALVLPEASDMDDASRLSAPRRSPVSPTAVEGLLMG